ncbi:unnamed protein product [Fraxinus pennsylvanica]|uniref:Legume lectin domain-containing protein n=1 Tax=Fraxinus pennsylvanica TaxID=56036 RepID=A0AAD2DPA7_9LAMI|nr:unnamed protein product [Fraxinus pennsylvanica]
MTRKNGSSSPERRKQKLAHTPAGSFAATTLKRPVSGSFPGWDCLADLSLNGTAGITSSGLLKLTSATKQVVGQAFYPSPINFKNSNGSAFSFSTSFVFAIEPDYPDLSGHGIAFVLAPTRGLPGARGSRYLGLFNETDDGNSSNHVFAVELDTIQDNEFLDINPNQVGIDINSMISVKSEPAGYYANGNGVLRNLTLYSGKPT